MISNLPQGWTLTEFGKLNCRKSQNIDPNKYPDTTFELYKGYLYSPQENLNLSLVRTLAQQSK